MLCVARAWCHRDWVNGDVYFWNTISPKVTLMSLDILQSTYVKWVIILCGSWIMILSRVRRPENIKKNALIKMVSKIGMKFLLLIKSRLCVRWT